MHGGLRLVECRFHRAPVMLNARREFVFRFRQRTVPFQLGVGQHQQPEDGRVACILRDEVLAQRVYERTGYWAAIAVAWERERAAMEHGVEVEVETGCYCQREEDGEKAEEDPAKEHGDMRERKIIESEGEKERRGGLAAGGQAHLSEVERSRRCR